MGSNIFQNEYVTWQKKDAHSRAYLSLTNEDGKKIGSNLGLTSPEKEALCLDCHAINTHDENKGEKFQLDDGIGCESCHGAAENYLETHTARDATHKDNIANGMHDLVNAQARAKLCLTCHYGNEDKTVNHRLIGAGHPRLSFELDTFSMIQPKHWEVDDDYIKRKGEYNSVVSWLIGQIELGSNTIAAWSSAKRSKSGIWPELSLFHCYACHHSLTEQQWKERDYAAKPGELLPNVSALKIIARAFQEIDQSLSKRLNENLAKLHQALKEGSAQDTLSELTKILSQAKSTLETLSLSDSIYNDMLNNLVLFCSESLYFQYEVAEQVAMGISAIIAQKSPKQALYKSEVDLIYASLQGAESFKAQEFTKACQNFSKKLSNSK